jgi:GNAT superfamily N-acetyltransferase
MNDINIICIAEKPEFMEDAIEYIESRWPLDNRIYRDCIENSIGTECGLPRWYIMLENDRIIGSYGLIINDFISRQDLWPWFAALYIEKSERGRGLGSILLEHGRCEAGKLGYNRLYLCTEHEGYYEKYGWERIGEGFHPWDESSSIYECKTLRDCP